MAGPELNALLGSQSFGAGGASRFLPSSAGASLGFDGGPVGPFGLAPWDYQAPSFALPPPPLLNFPVPAPTAPATAAAPKGASFERRQANR